MKYTHTTQSWLLDIRPESDLCEIVVPRGLDARGKMQCTTIAETKQVFGFEQAKANARLMVSAPELAEMLQFAVDVIENKEKEGIEMDALFSIEEARSLIDRAYSLQPSDLGTIAPPQPDFRALALAAHAAQIEADRRKLEAQTRAKQERLQAHYPAARALIEAALAEMCGEVPDHRIEWQGIDLLGALVHLGDVTIAASFPLDSRGAPKSVRFTYQCYYFETLAELGKLIESHEAIGDEE